MVVANLPKASPERRGHGDPRHTEEVVVLCANGIRDRAAGKGNVVFLEDFFGGGWGGNDYRGNRAEF